MRKIRVTANVAPDGVIRSPSGWNAAARYVVTDGLDSPGWESVEVVGPDAVEGMRRGEARGIPGPAARGSAPATRTPLIATISDPAGTRAVVGAPDVDELYRRIAMHVAARAAYVLWPRPARVVGRLIARRRWRAAVDTYFAHVGRRWDPEWLAIHRLDA